MGEGLQRVCKLIGGLRINGKLFVWDYAADVAVPEDEMPHGSERWKASERAKYQTAKPVNKEGSE